MRKRLCYNCWTMTKPNRDGKCSVGKRSFIKIFQNKKEVSFEKKT